ncbi:putative secreted protein (Por secretion system target) [Kordia periserrulae]|uniref:Putative secreted protein (Por secretion system target) n=1 Tax=Kordia periserrulae TaxID=701523 RepID=A0A2T6BQS0_9FLAO|nr:T9SS type A sorting domain-containing protein [Kordia periserrulae]PTX58389.1 putative secreted protein (Por secretion system target) [Kordia periserrulae]
MEKCFFSTIAIILFSLNVNAQNCPFDNTFYRDLTPPSSGATVSDPCVFGGDLITVNVTLGETYDFSTCSTNTLDLTMTLYNTAGTDILATDDDGCGPFAGPATISWTATYTGTVNLLVDEFPCNSGTNCITLDVTWQETLGTSDDFVFDQVSIYPNPTSEVVYINLRDLKDAVTLQIFDINGRVLHTKRILQSKVVQFKLNAPTGLYFIELRSEDRKSIYKLIKN